MLIKPSPTIKTSEITDEKLYLDRRHLLKGLAGIGLIAGLPRSLYAQEAAMPPTLPGVVPSPLSTGEPQTTFDDITHYNNFYEFGTEKESPALYAKNFKTKPWSISIEGEVAKPGVIAYEDLIKPHKLEERIYRLRCVEAWSMVIPWVGIPLADILARFEPTSRAKFVVFQTLMDAEQMPGQKYPILAWPYREGLRIDEAVHPLTILAVGLYGRELMPQNGAPIRLVVPWKYGFKSIKSIVSIRLSETMPMTTWAQSAPYEYGFYANVNPEVSHPRWSQRKERRLGEFSRRDTLAFNGYGDQVASLYTGMDLRANF